MRKGNRSCNLRCACAPLREANLPVVGVNWLLWGNSPEVCQSLDYKQGRGGSPIAWKSMPRPRFPWLAGSDQLRYPEPMVKKKTSGLVAAAAKIEQAIHVIRGQRVMLDADLAACMGCQLAN